MPIDSNISIRKRIFVIAAGALLALYALSLATSMAGMELFGYGTVVFAMVALATKKYNLVRLGPEPWFLAFLLVVAAGALNATTLPMKFRIDVVGQLRFILLLYALTITFIELESWQQRFLNIVVVAFAIAAVYGVVQSFTGLDRIDAKSTYDHDTFGGVAVWRARGFFSNTMSFAYCLGQVFAFAFAYLLCRRGSQKRRLVTVALTTILGLGLICTFTRGAWVGIGGALVVMAFVYRRDLGVKLTAGLAGVLLVGALSSSLVRDRLASIINEGASHSVSQRYDLWRVNWQMFKDHPIVGVGYGYNYFFTHEYNQKVFGHESFEAQTHNNFLQVLAGSGLPGFVIWLYFCAFFFWSALKLYWRDRGQDTLARAVALGSVGAQVFFHIGGLTQSTFFDAKPLHILLCGWALVMAMLLKPTRALQV